MLTTIALPAVVAFLCLGLDRIAELERAGALNVQLRKDGQLKHEAGLRLQAMLAEAREDNEQLTIEVDRFRAGALQGGCYVQVYGLVAMPSTCTSSVTRVLQRVF